MEEAERTLEALHAALDALKVLAELNKRKKIRAVDHSLIDYLVVRKNLYVVWFNLAKSNAQEMVVRRSELRVRVCGKGAQPLVFIFAECGLSERVSVLLIGHGDFMALLMKHIVTQFGHLIGEREV